VGERADISCAAVILPEKNESGDGGVLVSKWPGFGQAFGFEYQGHMGVNVCLGICIRATAYAGTHLVARVAAWVSHGVRSRGTLGEEMAGDITGVHLPLLIQGYLGVL
jgi:hypothetical protein